MEADNSMPQSVRADSTGEIKDSELESVAGGDFGLIETFAFAVIVNILDNQSAAEGAISRGFNMVR